MAGIVINYCNDILKGTLELLDATELKSLLHSGMKISIKPNMVTDKHPSQGATTHSEIVEGLICYLKDLGINKIEIIESAWVGGDTKRAYKVCGYEDLSKKYNVPLYDLKDDDTCVMQTGEYKFNVCRRAVETDFLINIPVLKAHCQTTLTCCLKNLKGCITDSEKRRFHTIGLHKPIAWLNKVIKTDFCLIDGICGDLIFEEGGNPVQRGMLLAGRDPVMMDSYCAKLIGYTPERIEYIKIADEIGVGRIIDDNTEIKELNKDKKPLYVKTDVDKVKKLSAYVNEDKACSACYSALIYALYNSGKKLDEKINIGQGFRGKKGRYGCGNCTGSCDKFVPGCPPTADDVVKFLSGV